MKKEILKKVILLNVIIHKLQIYQHKYHLPAMKDLKNKLKFIDDNIELIAWYHKKKERIEKHFKNNKEN